MTITNQSTPILSTAKLEANRRNAQLSTGPQSLEGKATVAGNAQRHGLTMSSAHRNRLPLDQQSELAAIEESLRIEFPLLSPTSEDLHAQLAWNLFLARRAAEFESAALAEVNANPLDDKAFARLARMTKYRLQLDRQADRQRKTLLIQQLTTALPHIPEANPEPAKAKRKFSEEEMALFELDRPPLDLSPEPAPEPAIVTRREVLNRIHQELGIKPNLNP
jgi:hypothetical protein